MIILYEDMSNIRFVGSSLMLIEQVHHLIKNPFICRVLLTGVLWGSG